MNTKTLDVRAVMTALSAAGMRFYISPGCGYVDCSVDDALELLKDRDSLLAKKCGLTKEQFLDFKAWAAEDFICRGTTKSGRQCRIRCTSMPDPFAIRPGIDDRCKLHRDS